MKKFYLLPLLLFVLFGCGENNTPSQPEDKDTITYKCDTINCMCGIAATWDLFSIVEPYAIYIYNGKDTIFHEFNKEAEIVSEDNCEPLYAAFFTDPFWAKRTPDSIKPEDIGVKYCKFVHICKYPAYIPYMERTDAYIGYRIKKDNPKDKYTIIGWTGCFRWKGEYVKDHWSGGFYGVCSRSVQLTKDEVIRELCRDTLLYRGEEYYVDLGSNSIQSYNY